MDLSAVALAKEEADARRAPGGETGKLLVFRDHQNALILRVHDCQTSPRSATGVGFHTVLASLPVLLLSQDRLSQMAKLQGSFTIPA